MSFAARVQDGARALGFTGALAAASLASAAGGEALAQDRGRGAEQSGEEQPAAARFQTPDGSLRFVVDRSGPAALIQFEGNPEVLVLRPDPRMGAQGNHFYRTADGSVVLRVTPWGELTVFARNDRMGAPATLTENAEPLRPAPATAPVYRSRVRESQQSLVRRVGRPVDFEAPEQADSMAAGVIVDAAERAADGLAASPGPIRRVIFRIGAAPEAVAQGDTLIITVAPQLGYAGRPSSAQIQHAIDTRQ